MKKRVKIPAWRRLILSAFRCKVHYTATTPKTLLAGPTIIACNHVSMLDGVLVALASPSLFKTIITLSLYVGFRFSLR